MWFLHLSPRVSIRINAGAVGVRSPGFPGRKRESRPSRKNYYDYCVNGRLAVSDGNSKDLYGSKLKKERTCFHVFLIFVERMPAWSIARPSGSPRICRRMRRRALVSEPLLTSPGLGLSLSRGSGFARSGHGSSRVSGVAERVGPRRWSPASRDSANRTAPWVSKCRPCRSPWSFVFPAP